jgi:hypothetical protein
MFAPETLYSATMDPVAEASAGEWYEVQEIEAGWALVRWEHDPSSVLYWIDLGVGMELVWV